MPFEFAVRLTEILLALAFLQQSLEHIFGSREAQFLFSVRAALSLVLLSGHFSEWALLALTAHSILILHRYQGPYNGGSDRMSLLILYTLCLSHWLPAGVPSEAVFGYLAIQVVLSYFMSGYVKIINPEWRSGQALQDVFDFSAYPVADSLRQLKNYPRTLWAGSWAVMVFEVLFPMSLFHSTSLIIALVVATAFHVANACLFGLNRFVWAWIAAYPSILWLQGRLVSGV